MRFQGHQPQSGERFVGKSFAALRLDSLLIRCPRPCGRGYNLLALRASETKLCILLSRCAATI